VVENNLEKMVRRHPHVFGDVTARTAEKVSENWEKIKLKEKGAAGRAFSVEFYSSKPACLAEGVDGF
jgi:tetrapyrrole methylase family protein/MazG family protein